MLSYQGMKFGALVDGRVQVSHHPAPSWGQAPALHFSFDSRREPAIFVPTTRWVAGTIHPGSESGTCFRTNDRTRGRDGNHPSPHQ